MRHRAPMASSKDYPVAYLRILNVVIPIFLLLFSMDTFSEKIAVVYPESKSNYMKIYQQIIDGIKSEAGKDAIIYKVDLSNSDAEASLKDFLEKENIQQVISLGSRGYKITKKVIGDRTLLAGALISNLPKNASALSFIPHPEKLMEYLNMIAPFVKTLHVAYSDRSAATVELAKEAVKPYGITLVATPIESAGEAINYYKKLMKNMDGKQEAIWLPRDKVTANDKLVLPTIYTSAWSNKIPVFSSKVSHTKNGTLFSPIPDNIAMGKELVHLLSKTHSTKQVFINYTKSLKLTVNLKNATHLGIKFSTEQQALFDTIFHGD